jgi:ribonuclease G
MFREIVINAEPFETRVAILEDGELTELLVERPQDRRIVGDIYKGKVNAVLPGIQAAFLDIGLPKTAFLHASDMVGFMRDFDVDEDDDDVDKAAGEPGAGEKASGDRSSGDRGGRDRRDGRRGGAVRGRGRGRRGRDTDFRIESFVQKGQELLVQITKEPISTKGAKVNARLSLPGRYLVLVPGVNYAGVSRKIQDRDERSRLRGLLKELRPDGVGLIARTAAVGRDRTAFKNDIDYLKRMWDQMDRKASRVKAPALVHREMALAGSLIRDVFTENVDRVVLDDERVHKEIVEYLESVSPELVKRVHLYKGRVPIFDEYGIEGEIEKSFDRKVWLKRGGYIIIDQSEALVAIDVNTGRYTGKKDQEETIFRTNMEAAKEVARQLRLRDVGGIIVIDFIDMESESNKRAVLDALREGLRNDRSRTKTFKVSDLGLVEMTRQRERQSLLHYYTEECPHCRGTGTVYSLETVSMRVERTLRRVAALSKERAFQIRVNPEVAEFLFERKSRRLAEVEKALELDLDIRDDPRLKRDELRIVLSKTGKDVTKEFVG